MAAARRLPRRRRRRLRAGRASRLARGRRPRGRGLKPAADGAIGSEPEGSWSERQPGAACRSPSRWWRWRSPAAAAARIPRGRRRRAWRPRSSRP
ncbi:MAG: hypothetical protein EDQ89_12160 [Acidobacteria bacterium]|nr:MAG: hypothetical protein EDQ89_12160 [Acidobacteriota bacterium]